MNNSEKKKLSIEPDLGDLEKEYRMHFLHTDVEQAVMGIIIGLVSVIILSYIDFLFYGANLIFYELLLIRIIFLILSLTSIVILKKTKHVIIYDYCVFIWWMSLTVVILLVDYYRPTNYVQNQMIHILAAFCCYTIIAFPLRLRIIPALIITIWDVFQLFFFKTEVSKPVLNVTLATFIIVQSMGILISVRIGAYRRKQFVDQLQKQKPIKELGIIATTDSLTSLFNRRHFIELIKKEFDRFQRYGNRFTIMMLDLDHFKNINDRFGHPVGDEVLKTFGMIICNNKRQIDSGGRLGGEEFGILLPGTTIDGAIAFAERIQQCCNEICVETEMDSPIITVSIGITELLPDDHSIEDILKRMDKALYTAKNRGRNRYEVI